MMTPTEWLTTKADTYGKDATRLHGTPDLEAQTGLTGEQWAIVYTTVRDELRKCAGELAG